MNIRIIPLVTLCLMCGTAFGATNWWDQATICTVDETRCYNANTLGVDFSFETGWDVSGGCRGKKYICGNALTAGGDEPVAMERSDIQAYNGINNKWWGDGFIKWRLCPRMVPWHIVQCDRRIAVW